MNKKILAVLALVVMLFAGAVTALLTSYASASATATVSQSLTSDQDGQTLNAVNQIDGSTTLYSGETGEINFTVTNNNRQVSVDFDLTGAITLPTGETGAAITAVTLDGAACTFDSTALTYDCPTTTVAASTTDEVHSLRITTHNAATAGTYGASLNIIPV